MFWQNVTRKLCLKLCRLSGSEFGYD